MGGRQQTARQFRIGEELIDVSVRKSTRARTARIVIGPRRPLEVVVPQRARHTDVNRLLERERRWIERRLTALREAEARTPKLGLEGGIWLAGDLIDVEYGAGKRSTAELSRGRLVTTGPGADARAAIDRWYRREARERITAAADREARRLGLRYRSVAIRDQRTRWGSCSSLGNLSFSWRLVAAPVEILDYVVVHELCHLRELNHSPAFWRLLDEARPGWRAQGRWLHDHGPELHEYRSGNEHRGPLQIPGLEI